MIIPASNGITTKLIECRYFISPRPFESGRQYHGQ